MLSFSEKYKAAIESNKKTSLPSINGCKYPGSYDRFKGETIIPLLLKTHIKLGLLSELVDYLYTNSEETSLIYDGQSTPVSPLSVKWTKEDGTTEFSKGDQSTPSPDAHSAELKFVNLLNFGIVSKPDIKNGMLMMDYMEFSGPHKGTLRMCWPCMPTCETVEEPETKCEDECPPPEESDDECKVSAFQMS